MREIVLYVETFVTIKLGISTECNVDSLKLSSLHIAYEPPTKVLRQGNHKQSCLLQNVDKI